MKISELTEAGGVGKITKYNTTVDVKPGETERQAAKLFPMNKGGKPQPLHAKAAKNSTPNKLFNDLSVVNCIDFELSGFVSNNLRAPTPELKSE